MSNTHAWSILINRKMFTKVGRDIIPVIGHEAFEMNGARELLYVRLFDTGGYKTLLQVISVLITKTLSTNNVQYTCLVNTD